MKKRHFGELPPRYQFVLNPYPDQRISRCPLCEAKTGQKKIPLLIHIDPQHLIALNYTCRFCQSCELLVGHKHTIEHFLFELFLLHSPESIGNSYIIIGTVEKGAWRKGLTERLDIPSLLPHAGDFETYLEDLRCTRPGYYRADEKPPIMEPPLSDEWVKAAP
ncbi:hypothetical protein [Armatimonas sp.]|uniref:hypothetical protein n=1 Tax=Armatimonas sp. TaxID=1872638 RepID=UPI0037531131